MSGHLDTWTTSPQAAVATLKSHAGQKQANKFLPMSYGSAAANNVFAFFQALDAFDRNPTDANFATLQQCMQILDLRAVRLQEDPNSVMFYPNPSATPYKTCINLIWRFGSTQDRSDPSTLGNPLMQAGIFNPHEGQDMTDDAVISQHLAAPQNKYVLSNALAPQAVPDPNYTPNQPISAGNTKLDADPSHANDTPFDIAVMAIRQLYPHGVGIVTHGHGFPTPPSGPPMETLLIWNGVDRDFRPTGNDAPFPALFSIALAIELATDMAATDHNSVVVNAGISRGVPGSLVFADGAVGTITSMGPQGSALRIAQGNSEDTSDNVIHTLGGAKLNVFNQGPNAATAKDQYMIVELGQVYRVPNSKQMAAYNRAWAQAMNWYMLYDPNIHNPWRLPADLQAQVGNNMGLYAQLFNPDFVRARQADPTFPFTPQTGGSVAPTPAPTTATTSEYELETESPTPAPIAPTLVPTIPSTFAPSIPTIAATPAPTKGGTINNGQCMFWTFYPNDVNSVLQLGVTIGGQTATLQIANGLVTIRQGNKVIKTQLTPLYANLAPGAGVVFEAKNDASGFSLLSQGNIIVAPGTLASGSAKVEFTPTETFTIKSINYQQCMSRRDLLQGTADETDRTPQTKTDFLPQFSAIRRERLPEVEQVGPDAELKVPPRMGEIPAPDTLTVLLGIAAILAGFIGLRRMSRTSSRRTSLAAKPEAIPKAEALVFTEPMTFAQAAALVGKGETPEQSRTPEV